MRVPMYRRNPDGRAFIVYRRKRFYLGTYGSAESLAAYREKIAALFQAPEQPPEPARISVASVAARYLVFAERYYSKDGIPSQEFVNVRCAVADLVTLIGNESAGSMGPHTILRLQDELVKGGYARNTINARVARVKRCIRWCVSRSLIPASVLNGLWTVDGLRAGRTDAVETAPVKGVASEHVRATLPYLSPVVAAMVQVQYLCGMRPAEVCAMRMADLDMSQDIWIYRPESHKGTWRNKDLIKAVPPAAQLVLRPFLRTELTAHIFSATDSKLWHESHRKRVTKVYPCEQRRRAQRRASVATVQRRPFTSASYGKSILGGIARAAADGVQIPHWAPNQLRHSIGTEMSQRLGQQAAQRWLGHARLETTAIYAEIQAKELIEIAHKMLVPGVSPLRIAAE